MSQTNVSFSFNDLYILLKLWSKFLLKILLLWCDTHIEISFPFMYPFMYLVSDFKVKIFFQCFPIHLNQWNVILRVKLLFESNEKAAKPFSICLKWHISHSHFSYETSDERIIIEHTIFEKNQFIVESTIAISMEEIVGETWK